MCPASSDMAIVHAGLEIVIEEHLEGEEVSFFALIDGRTCIPLASAQVWLQNSGCASHYGLLRTDA